VSDERTIKPVLNGTEYLTSTLWRYSNAIPIKNDHPNVTQNIQILVDSLLSPPRLYQYNYPTSPSPISGIPYFVKTPS
jgi:hypothetical protein